MQRELLVRAGLPAAAVLQTDALSMGLPKVKPHCVHSLKLSIKCKHTYNPFSTNISRNLYYHIYPGQRIPGRFVNDVGLMGILLFTGSTV